MTKETVTKFHAANKNGCCLCLCFGWRLYSVASPLCAVCLSFFFVFSPDLVNKNGSKITTTTQNVHSRNKRFRRSMCSCALLLLLLVDKHEIRDYNHINERNTSHLSHKTHVINLPVTVCICAIHTRQTRSQSCQICLLIGF